MKSNERVGDRAAQRGRWILLSVGAAALLASAAPSLAVVSQSGAVTSAGSALLAQQKSGEGTKPTPEEVETARKYARENRQKIKEATVRDGLTKTTVVDTQGKTIEASDQVTPQQPAKDGADPAQPGPPQPVLTPGAVQPPQNVPLSQAARIVFDTTQHDFGLTPDQKSLVCNFTFRNTGTEKLVITAVNTGCGCTAAKLPKYEFAPGEGSAIEITYNPKGAGKQSRQIQVMTNDASQPQVQLLISAQVIPDAEGRPSVVQFGEVRLGESRTLQLTIVSRDPNIQIKSVESNGPEIVTVVTDKNPMELIEPELPGRKVIDVTLKDDANVGRVLRQLTVHTMMTKDPAKGPEPHEIKVNVFASVKGELEVQPAFLRVAPMMPDDKFEREVVVWRQGGQPFEIKNAEVVNCLLPDVKVQTEKFDQGDAKGYRVKVSGQAGKNPGQFGGMLVLTTDLPREPKVEIRLSGVVRQQANLGNQPGAPAGQPIPAAQQPRGRGPEDAIPLEVKKTGESPPSPSAQKTEPKAPPQP